MLCSLSTRWRRLPSAWLALLILVSISLSKEPSQDMVLPRYLKCSTLASGLSSVVMVGEGVIVWCRLVEHLRLSETDCQAEELGCLREAVQHLRWPLVRSRRQREPLGGEFAGFSSLLWVNAGRRGSRSIGNECRPPSPELGPHGTAYKWKRRWRGPGLVPSPASCRCWSRKHPSHCHWKGPGESWRHGRTWSSIPTLEDTRCVQGLSKVPPCWRCQKLKSGQWILSL